jgi:hypothetical protein
MKNIIKIINRKNDRSTIYFNKKIIAHIFYNEALKEWRAEYKKDLIFGNSRDDIIDKVLGKIYVE